MEKQEVTIQEALEKEQIFVSVRRNRLYGNAPSDKAPFKLVLAITAESKEGTSILYKIRTQIPASTLLLDIHQNDDLAHFLVYCDNAQTIEKVMEVALNGHTLRSNTRYIKITTEELKEKAYKFDEKLI